MTGSYAVIASSVHESAFGNEQTRPSADAQYIYTALQSGLQKRGDRMAAGHSKIAEIFKRLLPYIRSGHYAEEERYVVFGASSIWDVIDYFSVLPSDREDESLQNALGKLVADAKLHVGRHEVANRLSFERGPKFKTDALMDLPPHQRSVIEEMIAESPLLAQTDRLHSAAHPASFEDYLDSALAEEMVGRLPKAVHRAAHLEHLEIDTLPRDYVKQYFREAHRCYLYNFPVACAVLCRAIIESALEETCGSKNGRSFADLVKAAEGKGILSDDRPDWAIQIRDAGNDAVHNRDRFQRRWEPKLDEILLNTRKLLIDFYGGRDEPR